MTVKRTTSQMHALDIRQVCRSRSLKHGVSCTLTYQVQARSGDWQDVSCQLQLAWTSCNYGGKRPWWICPGCSRRVAILYRGNRYLCRHCQNLTYKSTRAASDSACYERVNKIRMKLGWGGGSQPHGWQAQRHARYNLSATAPGPCNPRHGNPEKLRSNSIQNDGEAQCHSGALPWGVNSASMCTPRLLF
jgi:hypothetical protein